MAQINDTDTFLVNRSNQSYQVQAQNLMAELQDTDLMLVNRGGTSYKATGQEIKDSISPDDPIEINKPTILAPPDGAGIGGETTYTPRTSPIINVGSDGINGADYTGGTTTRVGYSGNSTEVANNMFDGDQNTRWFNQAPANTSQKTATYTFPKPLSGPSFQARVSWQDVGSPLAVNVLYQGAQVGTYNVPANFGTGIIEFSGSPTIIDAIQVSSTAQSHPSISNIYVDNQVLKPGPSVVTLTDEKTYNYETDADMGTPISQTFSAGQRVYGVLSGSPTVSGTLMQLSGNSMTVDIQRELEWTLSEENDYKWTEVCFGGGQFVAVGKDNSSDTSMTSPDGINWEYSNSLPSTFQGMGVVYGGGKYVTIGFNLSNNDYEIYNSPDGANWTKRSHAGGIDVKTGLAGIAYGNGRFVIHLSPAPAQCMESTDGGDTWIIGPNAQMQVLRVAYGNGTFVVCGRQGTNRLATRKDGESTYTFVPTSNYNNGGDWQALDFANGVFTASGWSGTVPQIMSSTDGINWAENAYYEAKNYRSFAGSDSMIVGVSSNGGFVTSTDQGAVWKAAPVPSSMTGFSLERIAYGNGVFVTISASSSNTYKVASSPGFGADFVNGMTVVNNTQITRYAPEAATLEFVGSTPSDTPENSISTWGNGIWEVATDSAFSSPMVGTKVITPGSNQTLAPNERGAIVLNEGTEYWARLSYSATDPIETSPTSDPVRFETKAPDPVELDDVFSALVYRGNRSVGHKIDNGIDMSTGKHLLWIKNLNEQLAKHVLVNQEYPDGPNKWSSPLAFAAEGANGWFTYESGGFKLNNYDFDINDNNDYVSWTFKAAPGFFDVVEYEGSTNGTPGENSVIPHNLGTVPGCIIVKVIDSDGQNTFVYHSSMGPTKKGTLNTNAAFELKENAWNNTAPTDTHFTVGANSAVNQVGKKYVAYLFAGDTPGMIKCGSYVGNGTNSGGTVVDCGFGSSPAQWVMVKNTQTPSTWNISDSARGEEYDLHAETNDVNSTNSIFKLTPGGFTLSPVGPNYNWNTPGETYVYVAIAKESTTLFFDTEAFKTMTDTEVIERYGVDPYTTDLRKFGIQRLMEEPTGISSGYALCEGTDTLCPIEDLTNVVGGLEDTITEAEEKIADVQEAVTKLRSQFNLLATAEIPQAINGFFPLYTSEVESDLVSDNGESHSHEINGVTYYMPDSGVTLYHGNYSD